MPIETSIPLHAVSQSEFGAVAYEVVGDAFAIHKRLGRIFDESVYRKTLAHILTARAAAEVCIRLTHADFEKLYFMDIVVDSGCPFELKVASALHERHRQQLIQYLMLTDLHHGKLGGADVVRQPIETLWDGIVVGRQNAHLVAADTAFEITCLRADVESYEENLRRFLANTTLDRIFWVNVVSGNVGFVLLSK